MAIVTRSLSEAELETLLDMTALYLDEHENNESDGVPIAKRIGKQLEKEYARRYPDA